LIVARGTNSTSAAQADPRPKFSNISKNTVINLLPNQQFWVIFIRFFPSLGHTFLNHEDNFNGWSCGVGKYEDIKRAIFLVGEIIA
jgi:hypothetical protein